MTSYTFDTDENQSGLERPSGERITYGWDYENRNTSAALGEDQRVTLVHDGDLQRVAKQTELETTLFVWDGPSILWETDEAGAVEFATTHEPRPLVESPLEPPAPGNLVKDSRVLSGDPAVEVPRRFPRLISRRDAAAGETAYYHFDVLRLRR